MRLLLAPDKFKGTFTAAEVCALLEQGIRDIEPDAEVVSLPLADGGEGTLDALMAALGGTRVTVRVRGPMGGPLDAGYGVTPDGAAVIESARFCGLGLVPPDRRDPMRASSYGLGEAIAAALDAGVRRILLGLGGTATVDAGVGMARALGYRFEVDGRKEDRERDDGAHRDAMGEPRRGNDGGRSDDRGAWRSGEEALAGGSHVIGCGADLARIRRVDASLAHPALAGARITALCDVRNPLCGPEGAARVFAPQKGAGPGEVELLEAGLDHVAGVIAQWREVPASEVRGRPFGGAAGGLGIGAAAFLGAHLEPGAIFLLRTLFFTDRARGMDAVVTGEGSLDAQTTAGKVVAAVMAETAPLGIPLVVVAGRWDGTLPSPRPGRVEIIAPGHGSGSAGGTPDAGSSPAGAGRPDQAVHLAGTGPKQAPPTPWGAARPPLLDPPALREAGREAVRRIRALAKGSRG